MKKLYENLCFVVGLIIVGSSFASDYPVYSDIKAELDIPAVNVDGTAGVYQDIRMKFEGSDTLRMLSVTEGVLLYEIEQVDVFQTNTFPVQVFLEISGNYPTGCGQLGRIQQIVDGNRFNVHVYFENDEWVANPLVPCTLAQRPFKEVFPLDVYGLAPGNYEYTLNDKFSGSFTLATDNNID